jgi:fatty acid amide hydrolase
MITKEMKVVVETPTGAPSAITDLSAGELAYRIRAGEISAQEVVESHIRRIEEVDERLNAVVIRTFDDARARAAEADSALRRGDALGPLHGVPVTLKEQFRVAGTEVTIGLPGQVGRVYDSDGPLVQKLRQAGSIVLGKTNVPQLLATVEVDSAVYGRANNPWNLDRTPGGSSGGEAAIIAAGGSPLGLGGDLGGSVRVPAHFTGIHALKPTSGRLTNEGVPPHLYATGQEAILAQPGPMARTVADLALAMEVLTAPADRLTVDAVPPVPWRGPAGISLEGLRVGMYTDNRFFSAAPALRRAVEEAAAALEKRGARVEAFEPPDTAEALRIWLGILTAGGAAGMKALLDGSKPEQAVKGMLQGASLPNRLRPLVARIMAAQGQEHLAFLIRAVGPRSAADYWDLVDARTAYRAAYVEAMATGGSEGQGFDALICPPFALPALTHGTSGDLVAASSYALPFNVTGMPAGTVAATRVQPDEESDRAPSRDPVDRTARMVEENSAGLPVGVQVVGRHWREDVVLAVMAALEQDFRATGSYPATPVTN